MARPLIELYRKDAAFIWQKNRRFNPLTRLNDLKYRVPSIEGEPTCWTETHQGVVFGQSFYKYKKVGNESSLMGVGL